MTYDTPQALRMALEQRLLNRSHESGVGLDRLRRRVIFERVVSRLQFADPGRWVLKGGMALEVRLRDAARLTKDIDLGLRADSIDRDMLHERLVVSLGSDPYEDRFVFTASPVTQLMEDEQGRVTLRSKVAAQLAGKTFGGVQLDISPRKNELHETEFVSLPNSLAFAGVDAPTIEIVDVHRHAAEKFHAMTKDFGDRENTRVRDLVDLVILVEHDQLDHVELRDRVTQVWREREDAQPPGRLPPLPLSWRERYASIAVEHHLGAQVFEDALSMITALWLEMFPMKET